jgi:hypothetical protein
MTKHFLLIAQFVLLTIGKQLCGSEFHGADELIGTPNVFIRNLSADGSAFIGTIDEYGRPNLIAGDGFRWTRDAGLMRLKFSPIAVSRDGSLMMGVRWERGTCNSPENGEVFEWTFENGVRSLNIPMSCPSGFRLRDASDDGSVLAGTEFRDTEWNPVRYERIGESYVKQTLLHGSQSPVNEVSDDGSAIIGTDLDGTTVFRWTKETGIIGLGVLPGYTSSKPGTVSPLP